MQVACHPGEHHTLGNLNIPAMESHLPGNLEGRLPRNRLGERDCQAQIDTAIAPGLDPFKRTSHMLCQW